MKDDFCVQYRNLTFPQEFHLRNVGLEHPGAGMALPDKIKAATAYCLGLKPTWYAHDPNAFPWSVGGFRALCDIKANATAAKGIRRMPPRAVIEQVCFRFLLLMVRCMFLHKQITHLRAWKGRDCRFNLCLSFLGGDRNRFWLFWRITDYLFWRIYK